VRGDFRGPTARAKEQELIRILQSAREMPYANPTEFPKALFDPLR